MPRRRAAHEFLDTSAPAAATAWDDLLSLQVDLFFPHELDHLLRSASWQAAGSVLDVGCGNGDYLARLQRHFPAKTFAGVDASAELVESARRRHPEIAFAQGDLFAFRPEELHDAVVMRLVVQHLSDFKAILQRVAGWMTPSGRLYVIEPDMENTLAQPPLSGFERMIAAHEAATARHGRLRTRLADLPALAAAAGWAVRADTRLGAPWCGPLTGSSVHRMYQRWIDLCEQAGTFAYRFDEVRGELDAWAARDDIFTRFGIRIVELEAAG